MFRTRHHLPGRTSTAASGHRLLTGIPFVALAVVLSLVVGCGPTPNPGCDGACTDSGADTDSGPGTDSSVPAMCGNGVQEGAEACDGADLGGDDCVSVGFAGGALLCDGACQQDVSGCIDPPTVPVLRKPMNGAHVGNVHAVGSLRPVFQWEPSTVGGGLSITYELEYDTDPAFAAPTIVSDPASTHQPAADLIVSATPPVGARYYWRVRACVGASCSAYSPSWYFDAGRGVSDFNGDGYDDSLVGALNGGGGVGRAYIYFGGVAGGDTTADRVFDGEAVDDDFGFSVAAAGDVNGDGFTDAIVGAYANDAGGANAGRAYVYLGGDGAAFDTIADGIFTGGMADATFGISVASAGDVNGDGFADVIVGSYGDDAGGVDAGSAMVYFGGPGTSVDTTADSILVGLAADDNLGVSVASAGDVNGDGFSDVIVGANGNDAGGVDAGAAYLYLGAPGMILDPVSDATLLGEAAGDSFGAGVASAGDVNGDGFADLIVGARSADPVAAGVDAGAAYLFLGAAGTTLDTTPDGILQGGAAGDRFGRSVSGAGDLNADGYADVVVGAHLSDLGNVDAGAAYVFFGGTGSVFDGTADGTVNSFVAGASFGRAVSVAGDLNGDGFADVIIGALNNSMSTGIALVYLGGPGSAFEMLPDLSFVGEAFGDGLGVSVASLGTKSRLRRTVGAKPHRIPTWLTSIDGRPPS